MLATVHTSVASVSQQASVLLTRLSILHRFRQGAHINKRVSSAWTRVWPTGTVAAQRRKYVQIEAVKQHLIETSLRREETATSAIVNGLIRRALCTIRRGWRWGTQTPPRHIAWVPILGQGWCILLSRFPAVRQ